MTAIPPGGQNIRELESQFNAIQSIKDCALYEVSSGKYKIITLTWYHRIVRYFKPEWYDSVPHLPKIAQMMLQEAANNNASEINFTKMTERLENLLFKDIFWQESKIKRDRSHLEMANKAVDSVVSLRDMFVKKPEVITLAPVLNSIKDDKRLSHEDFATILIDRLSTLKEKSLSQTLSPSFEKDMDLLLSKTLYQAKQLPGFWPVTLFTLILHLESLTKSAKLAPQEKLSELRQIVKKEAEQEIKKKLQTLLHEPCANPAGLNWLFKGYVTLLGWEAFRHFLEGHDVCKLAQGVAKMMHSTLHVEHQRMGKVRITVASLAQPSNLTFFSDLALQWDKELERLSPWVDRISNYEAVTNTFNRQSLGRTNIGRESLDQLLAKYNKPIPDKLKVPLLCEELLLKCKKILPDESEENLQKMVAQMVSLIACEQPNPVSLPREFLGVYDYLTPKSNLLLSDGKAADESFDFELNKERRSIACMYRSARNYILKQYANDDLAKVEKELPFTFSVKIEKNFSNLEADWVATLRTEKQKD